MVGGCRYVTITPFSVVASNERMQCWGGCRLYIYIHIVFNDVQQVIADRCYCNGMQFIKAIFIFRAMVSVRRMVSSSIG